MRRIVVVGIHTEVGKTLVATVLTEALNGYYWKPVQCGMPCDETWVQNHLCIPNRCFPSTYALKTPCSPHLAARREGVQIELSRLVPPMHDEILMIEGTGGILAPLTETESWISAAMNWNAQWVLVHRHYLGSLNHFFLTVEALRLRKISLSGVIFNGEADLQTEEMLLGAAQAPCLGRLTWQRLLTPSTIQRIAREWKPILHSALGV
jgi:dethiobiotin synthetase